ncbi:unnamed protein product [Onchocerca ochengi]|uniref:TIL domain-containing protein n=1 Tax=Onchocerca ochengi TaxID=42157 RepID=A0A182EYK6_ONCOC|nr:unnamed protein product [Onchocerca ochengi]
MLYFTAPCDLICNPPGCYCSPLYGLRRDSNGKCISKHQCPRRKYLNAPKDFILETNSVTHWNISEDSMKFRNITS